MRILSTCERCLCTDQFFTDPFFSQCVSVQLFTELFTLLRAHSAVTHESHSHVDSHVAQDQDLMCVLPKHLHIIYTPSILTHERSTTFDLHFPLLRPVHPCTTSQVTLPINKHCADPQNEECGSVAKTTSSTQPVLFAKDVTLPDPSSTSNPELKCVLQLGLQLVKDSIYLAATKWTRTAKHRKGVVEQTTEDWREEKTLRSQVWWEMKQTCRKDRGFLQKNINGRGSQRICLKLNRKEQIHSGRSAPTSTQPRTMTRDIRGSY